MSKGRLKKLLIYLFTFKKYFDMEFLKYGLGIDMAMEKFDACISIIDKLQHVTIRAQCSLIMTKKDLNLLLYGLIKTRSLQCRLFI